MAAAAADSELRRSARRQLGKWAKIMCQIVGLERVAEELMGRREWTSYQDIMVGQETKGGEPICPATLRPNITIREGSRSPMAGGWYIRPSSPEPQPLDLSAKPPKPPASPNKTIFKAKPRLPGVGGRRSYTEDELQAALRDIQSGKLGTRRAAVIYGIPRSTLRNKVYKISQESRDPDDEESDAEEERETEQLLNRPLTVQDILRLSSEVRASCLQQLLSGASTSSEELPAFNGTPAPIPTAQPLDFRRTLDNNNTTSADNNHPEEKKPPPQNTTTTTSNNSKPQQGGKGTRPKRGKYRNYDRDSLVEAVRAVQRGEMSVHRAGSYYGVPHSTLEYKVKERHLMRPRKREPKPRPPERKDPPPRPQPNGLVEPFEPRYPFPYWQAPFPLFGRPEIFARDSPQLTKSAREMAESLLETAEKGSFLDGIIRSSLDTPSRETGGKVLLEQLCRGSQMEKPATPPPPPVSPTASHSPKDQQPQN